MGTRRDFLLGLAAMPLVAQTAKLKVVVTGGHPGDPEYGCGGTVARYADLGHEVVLLYLNHARKAARPWLAIRAVRSGRPRRSRLARS